MAQSQARVLGPSFFSFAQYFLGDPNALCDLCGSAANQFELNTAKSLHLLALLLDSADQLSPISVVTYNPPYFWTRAQDIVCMVREDNSSYLA
ncbi:hypothetical protein H0H87_006881 [Tephrocybe sp. NHM501043]|nr:hypothetical protein H0H87_006881 [Tephrocybe sp. NHM501043]